MPTPEILFNDGAAYERYMGVWSRKVGEIFLDGIDPSEEQLAYARALPALRDARFRPGNAMALPFPDNAFDAAVKRQNRLQSNAFWLSLQHSFYIYAVYGKDDKPF